jgi:hypothetical protein
MDHNNLVGMETNTNDDHNNISHMERQGSTKFVTTSPICLQTQNLTKPEDSEGVKAQLDSVRDFIRV